MGKKLTTAGIAEKNGKYFIALRKPGENLGKVWEFPGGKVDHNESPQDALVREYKEEFNIDIKVISEIFETDFKTSKNHYILKVYKIEIIDSSDICLEDHIDCRWETLNNIMELEIPDSDKKILNFLIENNI